MARWWVVSAVAAAMAAHLAAGNSWLNAPTYLLVMVGGAVAAALGARRAPPPDRAIPLLIALGLAFNALAEGVWYLYNTRGLDPQLSWADLLYLLCYVFLFWAVWLALLRGHGGRISIDVLLDVATISTVSVLVFFNLSVRSIVNDRSLTLLTRLVLSSYPILDALLLTLVLRTMGSTRGRRRLGPMFAVGAVFWLLPDIGYLVLDSTVTVAGILDLGWMVGVSLMAASTWRQPQTAPVPNQRERSETWQLLVAVLPLLVPPVLDVFNEVAGRPNSGLELLLSAAVLLALAFVRTARLLRSEREARRELADARDAALDASRAKSTFLATMSHEIRTPMNGVIGLTELLKATDLDERQRQYVDGVRVAGHALLSVLNDILDFSKVEAGRLELEVIEFDPVQVIEEATAMVADTARVKSLRLRFECAPGLPAVLCGDPARLRQVLLNLTSNAVKFTESGEVVVRARVRDRHEGSATVLFEVSDSGIGIAAKDQDKLFQPFSQADSSTTRRFGGTGLGLAICCELVTAMDGEIGVRSELGRGSTFWVTLPFGIGDDSPVAAEEARGGQAASATETRGRVLVVDDNEINQMVAVGMLEHLGFSADTSDDGAQALAALEATSYDVVLMDARMPGMDGFTATRTLRAREQDGRRRTPVVALTAGVTEDERQACLDAGMDDYIPKPIDPVALETTLARWVQQGSTTPPS